MKTILKEKIQALSQIDLSKPDQNDLSKSSLTSNRKTYLFQYKISSSGIKFFIQNNIFGFGFPVNRSQYQLKEFQDYYDDACKLYYPHKSFFSFKENIKTLVLDIKINDIILFLRFLPKSKDYELYCAFVSSPWFYNYTQLSFNVDLINCREVNRWQLLAKESQAFKMNNSPSQFLLINLFKDLKTQASQKENRYKYFLPLEGNSHRNTLSILETTGVI